MKFAYFLSQFHNADAASGDPRVCYSIIETLFVVILKPFKTYIKFSECENFLLKDDLFMPLNGDGRTSLHVIIRHPYMSLLYLIPFV